MYLFDRRQRLRDQRRRANGNKALRDHRSQGFKDDRASDSSAEQTARTNKSSEVATYEDEDSVYEDEGSASEDDDSVNAGEDSESTDERAAELESERQERAKRSHEYESTFESGAHDMFRVIF